MSTNLPTATAPGRRRGRPRLGRYKPPGHSRRQRLAEKVTVEVTELVKAPPPAPKRRKPKPRYYTECPTCSRKIAVSATFSGVRYCEQHVNPAKRPMVETEADVIRKMRSQGIHGERTRSNTRRTKKRERFDTSDRDYL